MWFNLYLLTLAVIVISVYVIKLLWNETCYWHRLHVTSPKRHWPLGHLNGVHAEQSINAINHKYYRLYKRSGLPFVGLYAFFRPVALITDLRLAVRILTQDFSHFHSRGLYHNTEDLSSNLFTVDYDSWKTLRAKLSPTFTNAKLKGMLPKFLIAATQLVEVLAEDSLQRRGIVDIKDLMLRFTIDIIGSCAFGIQANSLQDANSPFSKIAHQASIGEDNGLVASFFMICFPKIARALKLRYMPQYLTDFYINFVKSICVSREKLNIRHKDFMDLLMDGNESDATKFSVAAANALLFFQAGYETSAFTLTYALYELARRHDIQQQARQEIYSVLAEHNDVISYESLGQMKYLQQIIKETLRLYPVSPTIVRQCTQDYVITDYPDAGPITIKKGQLIVISAYSFQRDEQYYSQAETFNPDNFAKDNEYKNLLLTFGDGPRNCIGKRFAHMQIALGLVLLLQNFTFEFCEKTEDPIEYKAASVLLAPNNEIYLKVNKYIVNEG